MLCAPTVDQMQLDAEVPSIQITESAYDDLSDILQPNAEEMFEDLNNVTDDTYNETSLNWDEDDWRSAINYIFREMRLESPIEDFFFDDFYGNQATNYIFQIGNNDFNLIVHSHDYNFDENLALQEHNAEAIISEDNLLDSSLSDGSWSIPDVEMELDGEVQFKYDVTDQFNGERDIMLPYPELDSTTLAIEGSSGSDVDFEIVNNNNTTLVITGSSGLNVDFEIIDNNECNNEDNYNREPEANTVSDNLSFPCSTNLPMTTEELQEDIQKYLNTEEDFSYASFDEYEDLINGTCDAQRDNTNNVNNNSELLQEYINEQNQLMQTLDPINPNHFFEKPNSPLFVHKRSHAPGWQLRCTVCNFATADPYELRVHKVYKHGSAYCCQICSFITYSKPKIRSHLIFNH